MRWSLEGLGAPFFGRLVDRCGWRVVAPAAFGLSCAKSIDATSDICYCLKRQNNAYFNRQLLLGELDLSETVLIVDEVRP